MRTECLDQAILFPATPTVKTHRKETLKPRRKETLKQRRKETLKPRRKETMDLTMMAGCLKHPLNFTATLKVKMGFNPRAIGPHDGTGQRGVNWRHCCS